eukprot:CAMPEP_0117028272 /NCGR_PEP_ID=MMETSP0472-20121206/20571_1 /TAXON_ID=693140 ORGANISM="Tiarina fusus, Strain LIS" /NCGR_SAMPLE_ID=MMETSP0472 /ASSEMBLY_ACC=CAM_ASM_000603 /LENGTH=526 /DNA_ID=CAMNT_0004735713 /DNA_START=54 /DNA_END=1631 /DNA_ORIENTATION=-
MTLAAEVDPSSSAALAEPLLPSTSVGDDPVVELASDPSEIVVHQVHVDVDNNFHDESVDYEPGEVQAPSCRDAIFAILFLIQAGVVFAFAGLGIYNLCNSGDWDTLPDTDLPDDLVHPTRVLLFLVSTVAAITVLSGALMMVLLSALAEMMIQVALVISPLTCGLGAVVCLAMGNFIGAGMFALFASFGVFYAVRVWHRIPYAAANVTTAVQAIRANKGVLPTAYIVTFATTLWTLLWCFALGQIGVVHAEWMWECESSSQGVHDSEDEDCSLSTRGKWIFVAMLLSLFWTIQVLKNIFQVTIAGVVGTWWFAPEDCATSGGCCCSGPLRDSWARASIYSLGSVCLGSLLVAILQVLKFLVRLARQQQEDENRRQGRQHVSLVWCLLQCVVDQLEKLVKYFNQWAFVYVGLYGYDYWTSSKKVYGLFRARGWSVILNDQLVNQSLGMMQLFVAVISGALGVVFGVVFSIDPIPSFFIGLTLGMSLSSIVLQVVSSAVNTIVVCFAEAPTQLQTNHPESAARLLQAW